MRRTTKLLPLLLCAALTLAVPTPASADKTDQPAKADASVGSKVTPNADSPSFAVKPGLIFNDPTGNSAQRRKIVTQISQAIDNAPKGSRIRIAQYLNDLEAPTDKLIAAYKRGVHVQLLIDDYPIEKQTARLRKAIGTNKKKASFVTRCDNSCMSSQPGSMHAKFFLFSVGLSREVSIVSSANLYTGNTRTSWNNAYTMVGEHTVYTALNTYFVDMIKDKNQPNYYRTVESGKYKLYFYPQQAAKGLKAIVLLDALRHVTCKAGKGYGDRSGRTVVRVEQWGWNSGRLDIAQQLWKLHDQGCNVQVILNNFKTTTSIQRALLKSSRRGRMGVYNAGIDTNRNGQRDKYMHHKVLAVSGNYFGDSTSKVVFTGSANFTGKATVANNELILRVVDNKVYDAFAHNFNYIKDDWTRKNGTVPAADPARDRLLDHELEAGSTKE